MRVRKLAVATLGVSLAAAATVYGQAMTDFQKQMMEKMMKQNRQDVQTGQKQPPVTITPELTNQGKAVFNDTGLGTNGKSCGSCHAEGQKPLDGREVDNHLVAYVQYCYEHALEGNKVIEKDKLNKLMAYFTSLHLKKTSASAGQTPAQQMPKPKVEENW